MRLESRALRGSKRVNKKVPLGITVSLVAVAAAITFIITMTFSLDIYNAMVTGVKEREEIYEKLEEIDVYVRNNFNGEIDEDYLHDSIADGYINGLNDKYSAYYNAQEHSNEDLSNQGQLIGIGVTITKEESGYIKIVKVDEASPAKEAGIVEGDIIVKVDGSDVLVTGYEQSVTNIKGNEGSKVVVTVRREGEDKNFELTRKKMEIKSVTGRMIENIGYVRISTFNSSTVEQFKAMVNKHQVDGAKGLIFDVRDNGGGTVSSVEEMLDFLLPEGTLATVTYKDGLTKVLRTSDENFIDLPMTIIVNNNTASAAELFAATIRDFNKGKLVGVTTYGKGVMQNTYTLKDGSAIKFTVGYYYPPKSANYDGVGLKPDYEIALEEDFATIEEQNDTQLQKAIEVLKTSIK